MSACVGRLETKPTITATCLLDPERQGKLAVAMPSDLSISQGLRVLVWNIHDRLLPGAMFSSKGHSEEEIACIGDIASKFDLVLFQEAFVRPAQIARYTNHDWADHPQFSQGGGGDWWPLRWVCEICMSPGLLMLAQEHPVFVHSEPYEAFAGWNTDEDKADDFFSKGFQLVQFPRFWVVHSHMDAGRGQNSVDARANQFQQITEALRQRVPGDARVLVGMDANLRPELEEQDQSILDKFLQDNGLTLILQHGPDLLATRNLRIERSQSLSLKGVLSDHDALTAMIDPGGLVGSAP